MGWWRLASATGPTKLSHSAGAGLLAGLITIEISLVGQLSLWMLLYHWILGRPLAESGGLLEGLVEFLHFTLISGLIGLLIGALGGLTGGLLGAGLHYVRALGRR